MVFYIVPVLEFHFFSLGLSFHDQKVADIIIGKQIVGIEIRFAVYFEKALRFIVTLVFIRIYDLRVLPHNHLCDFIYGVRCEKIIVIEKSYIIACGLVSRGVRIGGYPSICGQPVPVNPAVLH